MQARRLSVIFWGVLLLGALSWEQGCSKLGDFVDPSTQPVVTTSFSPTPPVVLPDAIHHWGFENSSGGGGTDDGTVGGWTGSLLGNATFTSNAPQVKVGTYALNLTGTPGDAFSLPSISVPTQMTFACWVRWTQGTGNPNTIFSNSTSTIPAQSGFRLYVIDGSGQVVFETTDGTTIVQASSNSNILHTGVYAHVAVSVDSANNLASVYINGVAGLSGVTQTGFGLTGSAFIGTMVSSTNPFNGDIDDCRVYDQVLSAAQIQLLYSGTN
jgi:Concanavalin A-like lectin/glucanases superfamily